MESSMVNLQMQLEEAKRKVESLEQSGVGVSNSDNDVVSLQSEVKDLRQRLEEAKSQTSSSSSQEEVESLKAKLSSQKDQMKQFQTMMMSQIQGMVKEKQEQG